MNAMPYANHWEPMSGRSMQRLLTAHLPAADGCHLTNPLYASGGVEHDGLVWYWESVKSHEPRYWVTLAADDVSIRLAFAADPIGLDGVSFDWRSYTDETRLLAWSAQHEPLIELLRVVFQRDWLPQHIDQDDDRSSSIGAHDVNTVAHVHCTEAGFSVHRLDGHAVTTGQAQFDVRLLPAHGVQQRQMRLRRPLDQAHAAFPIVIDSIDVTPRELRDLAAGCIVRLDNRSVFSSPTRVAIAMGESSWIADADGASVHVLAYSNDAATDQLHRHVSSSGEPNMNHPDIGSEKISGNSAEDSVQVGNLPVRLTFSAGQLTLPYGAVRDVAPGYVFELGKRLDAQSITVHANNIPIAAGELVCLGDLIGVRITRMFAA